jgi:hypothetical protein
MNLEKIRKNRENADRNEYGYKVESLKSLAEGFGISLKKVLKKYKGKYFKDTKIHKYDVFKESLTYNFSETNKKYLEKMGSISSHQNDRRTPVGYCCDLIYGWIAEDIIAEVISKQETLEVGFHGTDGEREFLKMREISTDPDLVINNGEKTRLVEIYCDWKDYWQTHGKADLRDDKYKKLVKENAVLFGISPSSKTGFLLDFGKDSYGFQPSVIYTWKKTGYTSEVIKEHLKPVDEILTTLPNLFE